MMKKNPKNLPTQEVPTSKHACNGCQYEGVTPFGNQMCDAPNYLARRADYLIDRAGQVLFCGITGRGDIQLGKQKGLKVLPRERPRSGRDRGRAGRSDRDRRTRSKRVYKHKQRPWSL